MKEDEDVSLAIRFIVESFAAHRQFLEFLATLGYDAAKAQSIMDALEMRHARIVAPDQTPDVLGDAGC